MKNVLHIEFSKINKDIKLKNKFKHFISLIGNLDVKELRHKFDEDNEHTVAYYATRSDDYSVILNAISGTVETMKLEDWITRFYNRIDLTN